MTNLSSLKCIPSERELLARGMPLIDVMELRERLKNLRQNTGRLEKYREENRIEFLTPNKPQRRLLDAWTQPRYTTFGITGSNQFGKTCTGVLVGLSTMFGKFLWTNPPTKLRFPHREPRKVRYICQDWPKHARTVVVPELEKWWPSNRRVATRNNSEGIKAFWTDIATGSTLELMTATQEVKYHAGWRGDLAIFDEPMSKSIYVETARGLVAKGGKELLCMTLLKEHAWIDQEIFKAVDEDGFPKTRIFVINGVIYDNIGYGIIDDVAEGGRSADQKIEDFIDKIGDDEAAKNARIWGIPEYMSGLVYPMFKRQTHVVPRFPIPEDWIIDIAIDTHPKKKQAVLFVATDEKDQKWLVDEIEEWYDPESLAHAIRKQCLYRGYTRVEGDILVDPLAKGVGNIRKEDSAELLTMFDLIRNVLWAYGYTLRTAGAEKARKKAGIWQVKKLLMGPNRLPNLFIFNDLKTTISQFETWSYVKDTEEPSNEKNEFMENLYRVALLDTKWTPRIVYSVRPVRRRSWAVV